jgi:flagellar biosynthetic protein FliR
MTAPPADVVALAHSFLGPRAVLGTLVLFCRIGSCLMLAPGISSPQIPVQARLFLALAVTLSLAPLLLSKATPQGLDDDPILALRLIVVESLIGGLIGLLARLFFLALETMATAGANMLGFASPFGMQLEANEAMPPLATFISLGALALMFAADLHWQVLTGLVLSYDVVPVDGAFDARHALREIADLLDETFRIGLRIASPFVIYALIVNLAISLINRLTPQIAVFYIATPFVAAGGLALLYVTIKPLLQGFLLGFGAWLATG